MALGKGLDSLIPSGQSRKSIRKETSSTSSSERIWQIPLSEITPNTAQPRTYFQEEQLQELVISIREHGILQPVTVTEREDGGYELIAGERRTRAALLAGLTTIPAIVRAVSSQEKLELALIENIQRADLNPIEEGFAYQRLIDEFGLTQEEVAHRVGKQRSTVANTLRLLDLPAQIQSALIEKKLSMGKARALLGIKDPEEQMAMFESMMGEQMSVRDIEAAVRARTIRSGKGSVRRDPNILAEERLLEERLNTKVRISERKGKGTITVFYSSLEELKRLIGELV